MWQVYSRKLAQPKIQPTYGISIRKICICDCSDCAVRNPTGSSPIGFHIDVRPALDSPTNFADRVRMNFHKIVQYRGLYSCAAIYRWFARVGSTIHLSVFDIVSMEIFLYVATTLLGYCILRRFFCETQAKQFGLFGSTAQVGQGSGQQLPVGVAPEHRFYQRTQGRRWQD